jgi:chromosome segregation ATPase
MSEHKESLVKVLEYIVNDEQDKAADLLHNVFVEKAKNHWASLQETDEVVEDDINDEDLDETIDLDEADDDSEEEVEEAIDASDAEEDFLDDIESAEEEIDQEEIMDDEDMDDGDAEMDLAMDMEPEADAEEGDSPDVEEAMDDVEDAIAELRAAFAEMQGEEPGDEGDMEETEESVSAMEEGASMTAVNVSHSDTADKASPVAGNAKAHNGAKAHSAPGGDESGRPAPAAKDMGVDGPQEAGSPSPAPKAKDENVKSDSPMKGIK